MSDDSQSKEQSVPAGLGGKRREFLRLVGGADVAHPIEHQEDDLRVVRLGESPQQVEMAHGGSRRDGGQATK